MFLFLSFVFILNAQTDCNDPVVINSLPYAETDLSTNGAGNNYGSDDACSSSAMVNEEYVFEITPTADIQINVVLSNTSIQTSGILPFADVGLFVVESCPDDVDAVCVASDSQASNPELFDIDLLEGVTYYIIVSSSNATLGDATNVTFDIEITENYQNDVGVISLVGLSSSCGLGEEEITVEIQNFGIAEVTDFDVVYIVNGGVPVIETFTDVLLPDEVVEFSFSELADLTGEGEYNIEVYTALLSDENPNNDGIEVDIINFPVHSSFPHVQDFESGDAFWTTAGSNVSWELGTPSPDATINAAASGDYCWVTNLDGDANTNEDSYLISPCYDVSALDIPSISFDIWRTFGLFGNTGLIEASVDGGETWTIEINTYSGSSGAWVNEYYEIPELFGEANVRFRFNYSSGFLAGNGMAVDNFIVREAIMNDVGISEILKPFSMCGLTDEEVITVVVKNYAHQEQSNIPVNFSIDGGETWLATPEFIDETIESGDSVIYNFTQTVDLTEFGEYEIVTRTELPGDENPDNNQLGITVVNTPFYSEYPNIEDFEDNNGFWTAGGTNSSWEYGTPSPSATIYAAASGENCWVTNLEGDANTGEDSYIYSPCFDLTGLEIPSIQFYIWRTFGLFGNEGSVEASIDGGETWTITINTYSGTSDGWVQEYYEIPQLNGETNVRFRFTYNSGFMAGAGIAIDDFMVREAFMNDVGITELLSPQTSCGLTNDEQVIVRIENFANAAQSNIPINLSIDGGVTWLNSPEIFTGTIEPGQTITYTMNNTIDLSAHGSYEIHVRTENPGDENPDNDLYVANVNSVATIADFDYDESFEDGEGGWFAYGTNSTMELGEPAATFISYAADGDNAWVTNLNGLVNEPETSYLQSPCLDFSAMVNPVFNAMIIYHTAESMFGMGGPSFTVEYSLDNENWDTLQEGEVSQNWYTDGILGNTWTGNSFGWMEVSTSMGQLAGQSNVSLRFAFDNPGGMFGGGDDYEGVGIDMISIVDCEILPVADFDFDVNGTVVTFTNQSENATSYLWEFNENDFFPSTSTEENPTFDFMMDGTYFVTLTVSNECGSDQVTYTVQIIGTDIQIFETSEFSVYPNPASSFVYVVNQSGVMSTVNLYNVNGQILKTINSADDLIEINIDEFAQGAYYIQILNDNGIHTLPLVIE